jgi:hypothetical protein
MSEAAGWVQCVGRIGNSVALACPQVHGLGSACVLVIGACTVETSISGACLACLTVLVFPLRVTSRALRRTVPWCSARLPVDGPGG